MEVMVAVVIVSIVIAALLQMRGDTSHKFIQLKKTFDTSSYGTFISGSAPNYGYESSSMDIYRLVEEFDLESDLRRKLKAIKLKLDYEELVVLDSSDFEDTEDADGENIDASSAGGIVFEIGKTQLHNKEFDISLLRIRVQ